MVDTDSRQRYSRANSLLAALVAALVVTILAGLIATIWYASIVGDTPRTEPERRVAMYEVAVTEQPDDFKSWAGLILAYTDVGRYSDAEDVYSQYVEYSGESTSALNPVVMVTHADIAYAQEDYEEALKRYEKAREASLELDEATRKENEAAGISYNPPSSYTISSTLGVARSYEQLGRHDEALEYYDLVVEMDPLAADILVERAKVYIELGQTDKARADLERAIELDPYLEDAQDLLAELEG